MTTPPYSHELSARLEAEAREDDARMTRSPWDALDLPRLGEYVANAAPIARTRNNLRAMADQLEAARHIIAVLSPQDIQDLVDENDRLRQAFNEMIVKLQSGSPIHSAFCCWCNQRWPHLDGDSFETIRRYTVDHAETCPAHSIRVERDAARARIAELEAALSICGTLQQSSDRIVTIADEAFGLGPVEPIEATLTRIERGVSEQRKRIAELEAEASKLYRAGTDGIDAALEHGVRDADRLRARVAELDSALRDALQSWGSHDNAVIVRLRSVLRQVT